jgi:HK97 family phage portal protein
MLIAARRAEEEAREIRSHRLTDSTNIELLVAPASSGARVNNITASTIPVVAACVGLFGDMVGKLPKKLYQRTDAGAEERRDVPASRALNGSDLATAFELFRDGQTGVGYGGNGYLRVYRNGNYDPAELECLAPCKVEPEIWRPKANGIATALYHLQGERNPLTRADLVHVRGATHPGCIKGISPITQLRESIGLSLAQREQAGRIAANGARFPGVISTPASLTPDQLKDARTEWQKAQAGVDNSGKTAILHGGWSYAATNGMSMADAEFLESRRFERTEICTLFRVPEVLLGNSDKATSWGSGIETLTNGFLTLALDPVLVAWEQALNYTLLTVAQQDAGFYFRFNRRAALAMLPEATAKFLREMRDIRVYSPNDCRRYLDENLLTTDQGGDNYAAPFNGSGGAAPATQPQPAASA